MDTNPTQNEEDARPGDLLVGADAIRAFLVHLGMPEDTDVYYLKRAGTGPSARPRRGRQPDRVQAPPHPSRAEDHQSHQSAEDRRRLIRRWLRRR